MALTSIVIVNWNTRDLLGACVERVRAATRPRYELVLVDNGSSDGSACAMRQWEDVRTRVVLLPENVGYAAGNNRGIEAAQGDVVCLLNSDAFVTRGWLEPILESLGDERVGMAGPCTNNCKGKQRRKCWFGMPPAWWARPTRYVDYLSFFCVAIRRDVLRSVGALDERFGVGCFEDDDYCRRARQAGYNLKIVGRSWVWHEAHATFRANRVCCDAQIGRNRSLFDEKWRGVA